MEAKKKFNIKVNSIDKVEQLLQETYNLACYQYNQLQEEINKIAGTTKLKDLDIEGKERYGKVMANYISLQNKCMAQKFDIAKLMAEVIKNNGDVNAALSGANSKNTSLDIAKLRSLAKEAQTRTPDEEIYQTKK